MQTNEKKFFELDDKIGNVDAKFCFFRTLGLQLPNIVWKEDEK